MVVVAGSLVDLPDLEVDYTTRFPKVQFQTAIGRESTRAGPGK